MLSITRSTLRPIHLIYFVIGLLVAVCNMHLLGGTDPGVFIFRSELVVQGEWYRLFTHPLVHVSWYHLLLDGMATILLCREVRLPQWQRLISLLLCATVSLGYALLASPYIAQTGFCGLSGIAHGLMFLVGGLWLFPTDRDERWHQGGRGLGLMLCLTSLGKSLWEVTTGQVLFAGGHAGYLGFPIVHSHLGGVGGGFLALVLCCFFERRNRV